MELREMSVAGHLNNVSKREIEYILAFLSKDKQTDLLIVYESLKRFSGKTIKELKTKKVESIFSLSKKLSEIEIDLVNNENIDYLDSQRLINIINKIRGRLMLCLEICIKQ